MSNSVPVAGERCLRAHSRQLRCAILPEATVTGLTTARYSSPPQWACCAVPFRPMHAPCSRHVLFLRTDIPRHHWCRYAKIAPGSSPPLAQQHGSGEEGYRILSQRVEMLQLLPERLAGDLYA